MTTTTITSPNALRTLLPASAKAMAFIEKTRKEARKIVAGEDFRKVVVVGPCSIHERACALEYAKRFKALSQKIEDAFLMVMRVYSEKPRTRMGWKGFLYDPHLDGSHDIETGLVRTRELLLTLAEMQVPCATEFVDPLAAPFFNDLISWGFVGARTCASQPHRQFASSLDFPIGFKNSTDGSLEGALYGALAAQEAHTFLHIDLSGQICKSQTKGNPYTHIVLRGADHCTNYDAFSVNAALEKFKEMGQTARLMIDCSHGNCHKKIDKQQEAFLSVLHQMEKGNEQIFGWMLESHLEGGNQPLTKDPSTLKYAVSVTDPCLDWETTEKLIQTAYSALSPSLIGIS